MLSKIIRKRESYMILVTIALWGAISTINANFALPSYLFDLIGFNSVFFICALGILPLMIKGHFDLSIGAMIATVSLVLTIIMSIWHLPFYVLMLIAVVTGMILGGINGYFIAKFKVSSVVVTLATMNIYYGVSKFLFRDWNAKMKVLESYQFEKHPVELLMIGLMILLTYYILKYHPLGRSIYAFGGDTKLAIKNGYSDFATSFKVHCFSGFAAGVAAVIHILTFRQANMEAYVGIEFELIIIVILGGLNILGGYGTVLGTFFASLFIVLLKSGLVFARMTVFWHDMIIGLIIIIIVSYDMVKYRKTLRRLMGQGE